MQDSSFRKVSLDIGSSSLCQYNIASAPLGPYQGFHLKLYIIWRLSFLPCLTVLFLSVQLPFFFVSCIAYVLEDFFIYTEVDILSRVNINFRGCRCSWKKVLGPQNCTSYLYFCLHQCILELFLEIKPISFCSKGSFFQAQVTAYVFDSSCTKMMYFCAIVYAHVLAACYSDVHYHLVLQVEAVGCVGVVCVCGGKKNWLIQILGKQKKQKKLIKCFLLLFQDFKLRNRPSCQWVPQISHTVAL